MATEVKDFARFSRTRQLTGYTGLGASEYSSGASRHQGSITKSGNAHLRRVLVEAAWHSRRPPKDTPARKKPAQKAVVAVARELLGFMWAIGQELAQCQTAAAA